MQLEHPPEERAWSGTVPSAVDVRVLGVVALTAALAASVNVPYGGLLPAAASFVALAGAGVAAHVLGERKLRRLAEGLVERWVDAGGEVADVTRANDGARTEWVVRTPEGTVRIGGLALVPIARLSIEWRGIADSMDAREAEDRLDDVAGELYPEIFEDSSAGFGPGT